MTTSFTNCYENLPKSVFLLTELVKDTDLISQYFNESVTYRKILGDDGIVRVN
jgi:hypothetical protein